jgi:hypothetical protein
VQLFAAAAQWVVAALVRSGAEPVRRHAEGVHAKFGHVVSMIAAAWNSSTVMSRRPCGIFT